MAVSPYDQIRERLPRPVGDQASVVALPPRDHHVVLGTAGSGKTTMALLRALFLSDDRTDHAGRTLLVTYNRSLLAYLRHIISGNRDSLHVRNYHHFARGYLNSRGEMHYDCILDDGPRRGLIEEAVAAVRRQRSDAILSPNPPIGSADDVKLGAGGRVGGACCAREAIGGGGAR